MVIFFFGGDINIIYVFFFCFVLWVIFFLLWEYCIYFFFCYGDFVFVLGLGFWLFYGCGFFFFILLRGDVFFFL